MKTIITILAFVFVQVNAQAQVWVIDTQPDRSEFDFQNFDAAISGKRVIFLGEEHHKVSEFNAVKTLIIEHLVQTQGFKIVLFESPLAELVAANEVQPQLQQGSEIVAKHYLLPLWGVQENNRLFDLFIRKEVTLMGIDPQIHTYKAVWEDLNPFTKLVNSCTSIPTEIRHQLFKTDSTACAATALAYKVARLKSNNRLGERSEYTYTDTGKFTQLISLYEECCSQYKHALSKMAQNTKQEKLLRLCIQNRMWMMRANINPAFYDIKRDSMMAANISCFMNEIFPNEKIIIWGHDEHIGKAPLGTFWNRTSIGRFLGKCVLDSCYVVGLKMDHIARDEACGISKQASKKYEQTLHADLHKIGSSFFIDVRYALKKNLLRNHYSYTFLHAVQTPYEAKYKPEDIYDGILYIERTFAPHFFNF